MDLNRSFLSISSSISEAAQIGTSGSTSNTTHSWLTIAIDTWLWAQLWLQLRGFSSYPRGPFHGLLSFFISWLLDSKSEHPKKKLFLWPSLGMYIVQFLPYYIDKDSQKVYSGSRKRDIDSISWYGSASHFIKKTYRMKDILMDIAGKKYALVSN